MIRVERRPLGQPTRGKTAPNRLRKTDVFLAVAFAELVRHLPGPYVDLGYGAEPITSAETLHRLRRLNPRLAVIGVEIDPGRVAAAQPFAEPGLTFRLGGFNLPLRPGEQAGVVRAFNVLRQYDEVAVASALASLAAALAPGGLVLEGTSDPSGRLTTFNLHRKAATASSGLERLGLVLAPTLRGDFLPSALRAVLPKSFIHHAAPQGPVDRFFAAWQAAWLSARRRSASPREAFVAAARSLAVEHGYAVDRRPALLRRGFLSLRPEWPAPADPAGWPHVVDRTRAVWCVDGLTARLPPQEARPC